jgi:hypothetical protein
VHMRILCTSYPGEINFLGIEKVFRPLGIVSVHMRILCTSYPGEIDFLDKEKVFCPLGIVSVHVRALHELPRGSKPTFLAQKM